ncbi:butyrate kinase [Deinococcus maricopensis]|uniref:Probable butyrate kinase n=1 Tax=Deinococcus maricopensis (strain DSM 21211 / LMG 22137 / NRRL B-23946 / LB-34) TaxID=709986 RepID=E8U795_DEIML|nr:butyrate kinase [Deinococcus maricopensis]ADV66934.1 Butyrate kinase [Deinococcus maricopensis DSM 21211]
MIAFVINPGSTSTKLALAHIESGGDPTLPGKLLVTLTRAEVSHPDDRPPHDLARLVQDVQDATREWPTPDAVVARGGLIGPLSAGTYRVTPDLATYALSSPYGEDAANVGPALALALADARGVPAFIVDPPISDELLPEARLTGLPGIERAARFDALNARAVARRAAYEAGRRLHDARVVVAHLGARASITAFDRGRALDTSGSEGPFTPHRAGHIPAGGLLDLAYSGLDRAALDRRLYHEGGFFALTGTADLRELERRERQEHTVKLVADAFAHQVAKAIGALSAALPGRPDAIALTGGIARWESLMDRIERRVSWIAPVSIVPGELELEALAEGAGRVLLGVEAPRDWTHP